MVPGERGHSFIVQAIKCSQKAMTRLQLELHVFDDADLSQRTYLHVYMARTKASHSVICLHKTLITKRDPTSQHYSSKSNFWPKYIKSWFACFTR